MIITIKKEDAMKIHYFVLLIVLLGFFSEKAFGQVSFSEAEAEVNPSSCRNVIFINTPEMQIEFHVQPTLIATTEKNWMLLGEQLLQVIMMNFDGFNKNISQEYPENQKLLLEALSDSKIAYYKKKWKTDIITPTKDWVKSKNHWWYICSFKNGEVPLMLSRKSMMHIIAATVIEDKILMINAPIRTGDDFENGKFIVNHVMEKLKIYKQ
jgi:hypothetical protein